MGPTIARSRLETRPVHSESNFPSHLVGSSHHFAQSKYSPKASYIILKILNSCRYLLKNIFVEIKKKIVQEITCLPLPLPNLFTQDDWASYQAVPFLPLGGLKEVNLGHISEFNELMFVSLQLTQCFHFPTTCEVNTSLLQETIWSAVSLPGTSMRQTKGWIPVPTHTNCGSSAHLFIFSKPLFSSFIKWTSHLPHRFFGKTE